MFWHRTTAKQKGKKKTWECIIKMKSPWRNTFSSILLWKVLVLHQSSTKKKSKTILHFWDTIPFNGSVTPSFSLSIMKQSECLLATTITGSSKTYRAKYWFLANSNTHWNSALTTINPNQPLITERKRMKFLQKQPRSTN